ncbi:non-structural maintenance of chromosomes element 4 homolog A [Zootoca vivipara]|uniref:non-structural maintenance of chromosomes element 4 homolog A n=1 Tax=Zootoca vivipara TaxID=8524 RepID=UPI00293BC298|nr:non-structural maintenance of chromosomes element 4 homolog A [Zootoca vivipara]
MSDSSSDRGNAPRRSRSQQLGSPDGTPRRRTPREPRDRTGDGDGGGRGSEEDDGAAGGAAGAEGALPGPSGSSDGDAAEDVTRRRLIRQQYRELISSVQQNREMMLSTRNDKLTEALEDANKLFSGVSRAREAALDAQFLVLASNLGKEKASQLNSELSVFDPSEYAEDLLTFMGLNRLEGENSNSEDEQTDGGFLPSDAWLKLGQEAMKYFRRAPVFHCMLGTFTADPPVERPRVERQRKKPGSKEEGRAMPAQLNKMEESHEEATEKEVERILGLLQAYHREDPNNPISFLEFVTDPDSFARTVENMFHVSFLIRDGLAGIKLDQDKLPVIEPLTPEEDNDQDAQARKQAVITMSYQEWENIVRNFEISEPMIPPASKTRTSDGHRENAP